MEGLDHPRPGNLLGSLSEGAILTDADGEVIYINPAAAGILGLNPDDALGKAYSGLAERIVSGEQEGEGKDPFSRVIDSGERLGNAIHRIYRLDGSEILVRLSVTPLRDHSGALAWLLFSLREASDPFAKYAGAQRQEESYRELIEKDPEPLVVHRQGEVVFANDAAAQLIGARKAADLIGKKVLDFVHPDYREIVIERIRAATEDHVRGSFIEEKFRGFDGRIMDVEVASTPVTFDGQPSVHVVFHDITERKAALKELQKYKFIFDKAGEEFYLVEPNGLVIEVNEAATESLGYSAEELRGMSVLEFDPEFSAERLAAHIEDLRKGDVPPFESIHRTKDGRLIHKEIKSVYLHFDGEEYVASFVRDITRRKERETRLRNSEERFRTLVETAPTPIIVLSTDGKFVELNPEAERLFGASVTELSGRDSLELFVPAEFHPAIRADMEKVLAGEPTRGFENPIVSADGTERLFVWSINRLTDPAGRPSALLVVGQDMTERIGAQRAVSESEARLKAILENSQAMIFVKGVDGRYSMVNPRVEEVLGLPSEEIIGRTDFEIFPEETARQMARNDQEVLSSGSAHEFEESLIARGQERFCVVARSPLLDANGHAYGIAAIATDVTERRRGRILSEALNEINREVSWTLDIEEIMTRVVRGARDAIGSDSAFISLREESHWTVKHAEGLRGAVTGDRFTDDEAPYAVLAFKKRRPVAVSDVHSPDALFLAEVLQRYEARAALIVPLSAHNRSIGVLHLIDHEGPRVYTEAEIDFASKLSTAVSLAIENAEAYQAEHEIATTLQRAQLKIPDRVSGIRFGALYRSATEATEVGGDFYDLFELEHGRVGIVVGDVSGKGLDAATLTSLVKNTIKAYAYEHLSPAEVMRKTNDLVSENIPVASFITVFFGILELDTGTITYCSGGHPPAVLRHPGGKIDLLDERSPIIGAFRGMDYSEGRAVLGGGDVIMLYTDGIIEAKSGTELFGEERLIRVISESDADVRDMPSVLFEGARQFAGGLLTDDTAILALTRE